MLRLRSLLGLYLGLQFWLLLPLLGLLFWLGGGLVTDRMLSRSYNPQAYLQVDRQLPRRSRTVVLITVQINKHLGFSNVEVKTTDSALKELQFQFPVTEFNQIEAAIAQELGLSSEYIRKLVRYQINDRSNAQSASP